MDMKTFSVDWNNKKDVQRLISKLTERYSFLNRSDIIQSPSEKGSSTLNSCISIFNANIEDLYEKTLNEERKYYVYIHCNPLKGIRCSTVKGHLMFAATLGLTHEPFYVGKGSGERSQSITRNGSHSKVVKNIKHKGKEPIVKIIRDGLTEVEALSLESKLIDIFGLRAMGGLLENLDEGYKYNERRERYMNDFLNIHRSLKNSP